MKRDYFKRYALVLALSALAAGCATTAPATEAPRIGVQLWSVKDEIKKDFEGTLTKLAGLGFQGVEFAGEFGAYGQNPAGLRAFLDKSGLRCTSAHVGLAQLSAANFDKTTNFYKVLGCTDLIVPSDKRAVKVETSPQVALDLSALSTRLAALGMRTGYHNHSEEMTGAEGRTPWDILATGTPHGVILQQDVGWTTAAGKDAVAFVKRYPGRTISMHYKAKFGPGKSGTPIIGQDLTDWVGLTAAARSVGGTRWLIVEQEEYPNGMGQVEAVGASLRGLQAVLAGSKLK